MISALSILDATQITTFKLLAILTYIDLPCMAKYPSGKITIEDLAEFSQHTGIAANNVKLHLAQLDNWGLVSKVGHRKNFVELFILRPKFLVYAGSKKEETLLEGFDA